MVTSLVGVGRFTENKEPLEARQPKQWHNPLKGGTEDFGMETLMVPQLHAPSIVSLVAIWIIDWQVNFRRYGL